MQYVFLIGGLLILFFWAPIKISILALLGVFVMASTVKLSAQAVTGATISYGDALKAVGYSFAFILLVLFSLFSMGSGGMIHFSGFGTVLVAGIFLLAYIFGYSIGLGTSFGASAIVSVISTLVSVVLFFVGRALI